MRRINFLFNCSTNHFTAVFIKAVEKWFEDLSASKRLASCCAKDGNDLVLFLKK
ncbi:hypothetical protein KR50_29580 [Jeotgalibacillus campisalis]|uniref:Uncharacterized protein n=1 Tax=Jeotgalibacillus campisalis TaxID=220754 RepID=A0A0C2VQJ4_9BACL|nr:hypothetical protein KR50_29580 [Jeotgalibacillus campisalis]